MPPLTIHLDDRDREGLLESWQWLLAGPHEVLIVTAMGDAFVADDAGAVFFLDTLEGALLPIAPSRDAFSSLIGSGAYDPAWFNPDMLALKAADGTSLGPRECYTYSVPPILGGSLASANVRPIDAAVHFGIAGQLHRQLAARAPGSRITGFVLEEP